MTATSSAAAVADDARRRPYLPGLHGLTQADAGPLPTGLRYLTPRIIGQLRWLLPDRSEVLTDSNQLNNQALVRYFEEKWGPDGNG